MPSGLGDVVFIPDLLIIMTT